MHASSGIALQLGQPLINALAASAVHVIRRILLPRELWMTYFNIHEALRSQNKQSTDAILLN